MIELHDIRKSFKMGPLQVEVLKGVSLTIQAGEMMSIMGQSGSGKSTLMNIIGMLDLPSAGSYVFDGIDVLKANANDLARIRNNKIGFVFQSFFLLPRLTALANVALPLMYRGTPAAECRARATAILERVGMGDRAHHRPNELSGGQCQRVAIARALVGSPALLLGDEPTGALDSKVGQEIMDLFIEMNRELGVTVALVTHDPKVAGQCRRRVVVKDGLLVDDTSDEVAPPLLAAAAG